MSLIAYRETGVLHEVGIALLISALLGGSIDFYLHRSIAKDAFEGAMGYFLPEEIKESVRFIGSMEWFAVEFSLTVQLEITEDDLVRCTLKTRKLLRNISSMTLPMRSNIHVDDWGHKKQAEIISCVVRAAAVSKELKRDAIKRENSTVYGETDEIDVFDGETVECLAEAIEYKLKNDDMHYALGFAAKSPKIFIQSPADFEVRAGISAHNRLEKHPHAEVYELRGFYLPWQRMTVRWWIKT